MIRYKFSVGDKVILTNDFGVCWGVRTIIGLDIRSYRPTYHIRPTDTPWFSDNEDNLILADEEDLIMDTWGFDQTWEYFQNKYGFTPTEWYGCY